MKGPFASRICQTNAVQWGVRDLFRIAATLVTALTFVMLCPSRAPWAIDADELMAKKMGKDPDLVRFGLPITRADILRAGSITEPRPPTFEIARTGTWEVAEKLASEGWELVGAVSYTTKTSGSRTSWVHLEYILRRPLK